MANCSLCGETMKPEGGAILFTDREGVPFEVCETCETAITALGRSENEEEVARALDYISHNAENVLNRDTYNSLMLVIKQEEEDSTDDTEGEEIEEEPEQATAPDLAEEDAENTIGENGIANAEQDAGITRDEPSASLEGSEGKKSFPIWIIAVALVLIAMLLILRPF